MKAHDLARQLLAGPNVEVVAAFDDAGEYACEVWLAEKPIQQGCPEGDKDQPKVEVAVLYYGGGSINYDLTQ